MIKNVKTFNIVSLNAQINNLNSQDQSYDEDPKAGREQNGLYSLRQNGCKANKPQADSKVTNEEENQTAGNYKHNL